MPKKSFKERVIGLQDKLRDYIAEDSLGKVKKLLENDAVHLNFQDEKGNTALHHAHVHDHPNSPAIRKLLKMPVPLS